MGHRSRLGKSMIGLSTRQKVEPERQVLLVSFPLAVDFVDLNLARQRRDNTERTRKKKRRKGRGKNRRRGRGKGKEGGR